jgi:hypothetical protein
MKKFLRFLRFGKNSSVYREEFVNCAELDDSGKDFKIDWEEFGSDGEEFVNCAEFNDSGEEFV